MQVRECVRIFCYQKVIQLDLTLTILEVLVGVVVLSEDQPQQGRQVDMT